MFIQRRGGGKTASFLSLLMGVVSVGCNCERPLQVATGQVRWEWETATGPESGDSASLDFGTVSMGSRVQQIVFVRNVGRAAINLSDFKLVAGDPVTVQQRLEPSASFELAFEQDRLVAPTERQPITVTFAPAIRTDVRAFDVASQLDLIVAGAQPAPLELRARAISGECEVPETIDFGIVPTGTVTTTELDLRNDSSIGVRVTTSPITGEPPGIFVIGSLDGFGARDIAPGEPAKASVSFAPTETRDYQARVSIRRTQSCPERQVTLKGRGVASCITFRADPPDDPRGLSLFFGYVAPGQKGPGTVTFSNACTTDVGLSMLETSEPVFAVTEAMMGDLTRLTVPSAQRDAQGQWTDGEAAVKLEFAPQALGVKTGTLRANTTLAGQPAIAVRLRGIGGGPRIDVRPTPLSVGRIGFTLNANPPTFVPRTLRIANVGTRPMPADPRANLKLGAMGGGAPYWRLRSVQGTDAEICVGEWDQQRNGCTNTLQPNRYDPNNGIEAVATGAINLPIRIIPATAGVKEWELTILSNDPMSPETVVRITAEAVEAPPCNYEVIPGQLNFGVVDMPQVRDLTFTLRNRGIQPSDVCYFNAIELAPTSDDTFSLPQGNVAALTLQPGQQVPIAVRAQPLRPSPTMPTVVRGDVTFGVSTPGASSGAVQLVATLAPTCITISPSPLDFMNSELECGSPARTVSITNTCSTPLTLNSATLSDPGLAPVGSGSCTTAGGCPQFAISAAATAGTISPGASRTLQLRFRPYVPGVTNGGLSVSVTQNGQAVSYPLPLTGTGVARTAMGCGVTAMCPAPITVGANSTVTLTPSVMAPGPVTCNWSVGSRPATANGTFGTPSSCNTTSYFADVVGTHIVNFTVSDGLGSTSTCSTPITVTPNGDLWIELTWSRNYDTDLHLIHPNAGPWSAASSWSYASSPWDCFYGNRTPTWGTAQQSPNLDRDDTTTRGPENTRINSPQPGVAYTIGVHMYGSANSPVVSTVKVYCGGQLVTTQTRSMATSKDMWVVGSVQFGGMSPCQFTLINGQLNVP